MSVWISDPVEAWYEHIRPFFNQAKWLEDSTPISETIDLSKRELFSLIIHAHLKGDGNGEWSVGYDPNAGEPNDGFITDGSMKIRFEHKFIPQFAKSDPLQEIIETYLKYAAKGESYGANRLLVVHTNQQSDVAIRISDLVQVIGNNSPFDRVFVLNCVNIRNDGSLCMTVGQEYPSDLRDHFPGKGMGQVDINPATGTATVAHNGIYENWVE